VEQFIIVVPIIRIRLVEVFIIIMVVRQESLIMDYSL
jgi:hypothetical protein